MNGSIISEEIVDFMQGYIPLKNPVNLAGKGAIVTGGAMGIGLAISYRRAEAGNALLIADINAREAQKASDKPTS